MIASMTARSVAGSVSFTPPLIVPMDPNFAKIRQVVTDKIAAVEAEDAGPAPSASTSASASPKPTATKSSSTNTDNLDSVCKVSG